MLQLKLLVCKKLNELNIADNYDLSAYLETSNINPHCSLVCVCLFPACSAQLKNDMKSKLEICSLKFSMIVKFSDPAKTIKVEK